MAKFYGVIGYAVTEETKPGVWAERISGNGTIGAAAPALFPGARRRPH